MFPTTVAHFAQLNNGTEPIALPSNIFPVSAQPSAPPMPQTNSNFVIAQQQQRHLPMNAPPPVPNQGITSFYPIVSQTKQPQKNMHHHRGNMSFTRDETTPEYCLAVSQETKVRFKVENINLLANDQDNKTATAIAYLLRKLAGVSSDKVALHVLIDPFLPDKEYVVYCCNYNRYVSGTQLKRQLMDYASYVLDIWTEFQCGLESGEVSTENKPAFSNNKACVCVRVRRHKIKHATPREVNNNSNKTTNSNAHNIEDVDDNCSVVSVPLLLKKCAVEDGKFSVDDEMLKTYRAKIDIDDIKITGLEEAKEMCSEKIYTSVEKLLCLMKNYFVERFHKSKMSAFINVVPPKQIYVTFKHFTDVLNHTRLESALSVWSKHNSENISDFHYNINPDDNSLQIYIKLLSGTVRKRKRSQYVEDEDEEGSEYETQGAQYLYKSDSELNEALEYANNSDSSESDNNRTAEGIRDDDDDDNKTVITSVTKRSKRSSKSKGNNRRSKKRRRKE